MEFKKQEFLLVLQYVLSLDQISGGGCITQAVFEEKTNVNFKVGMWYLHRMNNVYFNITIPPNTNEVHITNINIRGYVTLMLADKLSVYNLPEQEPEDTDYTMIDFTV